MCWSYYTVSLLTACRHLLTMLPLLLCNIKSSRCSHRERKRPLYGLNAISFLCLHTRREQNIEHQTSFQNTWYWIMASMQVAQTRWRLYTRKHITSFSKRLSILGYNLGFAFLWFEGCWGTMWGEGTISFIFMQVSLLYMYLMNFMHITYFLA